MKRSNLSPRELAKIAKIHPRSFFDWRRARLSPTITAMKLFSTRFNVSLPDSEKILVQRWLKKKIEASRKGALVRYQKYGELGTPEGRKKGGINSIKKRKLLGNFVKPIKVPTEDEDLAEFIGIMLGDGGLTYFQCVVYLNSETDNDYAYYVVDLLERLFGLRAKIYKSKKEKVWRIVISSVNLVKYLQIKGLSLGSKVRLQLGVPNWVWSKPEYVKACLRGLIDTDGCFVIHRYKVNGKQYAYPKIAFTNRSAPILDFVYEGLSQLGFKPKKSLQKQVWLYNKNEVRRYLGEVGTRNFKASFFSERHTFLEGGPDGKAQVC